MIVIFFSVFCNHVFLKQSICFRREADNAVFGVIYSGARYNTKVGFSLSTKIRFLSNVSSHLV